MDVATARLHRVPHGGIQEATSEEATVRYPTGNNAGRQGPLRPGPRAALALTLLATLLVGGLAHASRLCGLTGHGPVHEHASAPACAGGAGAAGHAGSEHGGPPLDPACCSDATLLAAVPAAKVSLAPDRLPAAAPVAAVAAASPVAVARAILRAVRGSPPGDTGARLHLRQLVLLI